MRLRGETSSCDRSVPEPPAKTYGSPRECRPANNPSSDPPAGKATCGCGQGDQRPSDDSRACCCRREPCHRPGPTDGSVPNPNRPGAPRGDDTGRLEDPSPLTPADLTPDRPPRSWVGPRKNLYLPFLFIRANPGDVGTRLNADGTRQVLDVFWESPDIMIQPGVDPAVAPAIPNQFGDTAVSDQPNTLYAHIWNFGHAPAPEVIVEFYWCDPSLGFNALSARLIAQTVTSLGARGSGKAHALVKCPVAWQPQFLNGGHECLIVRAWDMSSDPLGTPPWDASLNRHIGQRNIHVIQAAPNPMNARPSMRRLALPRLATAQFNAPLTLKVGPLFGAPARIQVTRVVPSVVPWLQLRTGQRGKFPAQAAPTGLPYLSKPGTIGSGSPSDGNAAVQIANSDDQQVNFTTTDAPPAPGEAHVYRVAASQGTQTFGGYTVIVMG